MYHVNGFTVDSLREQAQEAGFESVQVEIVQNRFPRDDVEYREQGDLYCVATKLPKLPELPN
jgi:hypothetical protein